MPFAVNSDGITSAAAICVFRRPARDEVEHLALPAERAKRARVRVACDDRPQNVERVDLNDANPVTRRLALYDLDSE